MLKIWKGTRTKHLWNQTRYKDFLAVVKDRLTARPPWEQRDRKDMLQLAALVFGSAFGVFYSFGYFSPETPYTTGKASCNTVNAPCKNKQDLPPCPDNAKSGKACKKS